jgi:CNT family concentrative nucleoside transporter
MLIIQSLSGLLILTLFAWVVSENRGRVKVRKVAAGLALQLALAVLLLKIPALKKAFLLLNKLVISLQAATTAGTSFVFGYIGGAPAPFTGGENPAATTFILALQALPLVLVVSALTSLLFYWRILPVVVRALSWMLQKSMGIGGALGLATAANIFVGMIEAPLFIRPYLMKMTRSELFTVMTCGMATIAGTVMVLYASLLGGVIPNALAHILIASIISAPAAITIAGIMVPETGEPTSGEIVPPRQATSSMDAVTRGTLAGLELLLNIIAMLVVLVALVHLVNLILGTLPNPGGRAITLQLLLGYVMAPVVWLMGIPWSEAATAGSLMGTKTILNEFLAYLQLAGLPEGALSERSRLIMIYAMCGFANFGSLGIMIGGLGTMAAERRDEIVALGLRSIVAGTVATCMTGAVVGIVSAL